MMYKSAPDIFLGFGSVNDRCHENRTMNGASQGTMIEAQ